MAGYAPDTLVRLRPFLHRRDGDRMHVGHTDRELVLEIPPEGLDILNWLKDGRSVGEASELYRQKHGEPPDIEDFLSALEAEGFLEPPEAEGKAANELDDVAPSQAHHHRGWFGLPWLSQKVAQRLVGGPALTAYLAFIALGIALIVDDPGLFPSPANALLFPIHFTILLWTTILLNLIGVFLHEVAHVVAARAAGMPARMLVGNQLYVVVAQTDMTGMWLATKRQRLVAYTIGLVVDAMHVALFIVLLWGHKHSLWTLPQVVYLLSGALLLTTVIRISWQFYFFLRTDGYYTYVTLFKCKSLMNDTEDLLRNMVKRLRPSARRVDQSAIPRGEMRAIKAFSGLWLLGRLYFIFVFVFLAIPILAGYLGQLGLFIIGSESRFSGIDAASIMAIGLISNGAGLFLWYRQIKRRRRTRARRDRLQLERDIERAERLRYPDSAAEALPAGSRDATPAIGAAHLN